MLGTFTHRYLQRIPQTPLVAVRLAPEHPQVWCKLEFLNPSGSTKDRIARYILEKAWRQGKVYPGTTVVEASSGSTSIAFALACAQYGLKFIAVMPEGVSNERVLIIQAYGGEVRFTPKADGVRGSIAHTEEIAKAGEVFLPRQFQNYDNAEAHRLNTAREVIDQIPGGTVDGVVSGVGTGGTLVGMYQGFCESGCPVVPILARPVNIVAQPEVECYSFSSRIPGVVDSLSQIFREADLPNLATIDVNDEDALTTTRLLQQKGFPVGPSSGLNYAASVLWAKTCGLTDPIIVTVFPDRMERYFTTELFLKARG
jgi:cysteine synthase